MIRPYTAYGPLAGFSLDDGILHVFVKILTSFIIIIFHKIYLVDQNDHIEAKSAPGDQAARQLRGTSRGFPLLS